MPPNYSRKDLPGGINDSAMASFDRAIFSWLGKDTNENVIRNPSLTLVGTADPFATALAAQQRSFDSLTKVVPDNRRALDFFFS